MKEEVKRAIEIATRRKDHRVMRVGCAIRRGDGAIVVFSNICELAQNPRFHAEARAVRKATPGSVAYVVRVKKDGKLTMAKPCSACEQKLRAKGIRVVFYSGYDGALRRLVWKSR